MLNSRSAAPQWHQAAMPVGDAPAAWDAGALLVGPLLVGVVGVQQQAQVWPQGVMVPTCVKSASVEAFAGCTQADCARKPPACWLWSRALWMACCLYAAAGWPSAPGDSRLCLPTACMLSLLPGARELLTAGGLALLMVPSVAAASMPAVLPSGPRRFIDTSPASKGRVP